MIRIRMMNMMMNDYDNWMSSAPDHMSRDQHPPCTFEHPNHELMPTSAQLPRNLYAQPPWHLCSARNQQHAPDTQQYSNASSTQIHTVPNLDFSTVPLDNLDNLLHSKLCDCASLYLGKYCTFVCATFFWVDKNSKPKWALQPYDLFPKTKLRNKSSYVNGTNQVPWQFTRS